MITRHHITASSGHTRISPRTEVSDEIIEMLRPLLVLAIDRNRSARHSAAPVALSPSEWYIRAHEQKQAQRLTVGLWWGSTTGAAHIEMRVSLIDQATAHCEVLNIRPGKLTPCALFEAGDLERCIAWTWIERMNAMK